MTCSSLFMLVPHPVFWPPFDFYVEVFLIDETRVTADATGDRADDIPLRLNPMMLFGKVAEDETDKLKKQLHINHHLVLLEILQQ